MAQLAGLYLPIFEENPIKNEGVPMVLTHPHFLLSESLSARARSMSRRVCQRGRSRPR